MTDKNVTISDAAARRIASILGSAPEKQALRVSVEGGGCSGFSYGFTFDEELKEGDSVFSNGDVIMLVDPMSFQYLAGSEVDYKEGLQGSQFVVNNPNASSTCGCGSSFSV